MSMDDCFIPTRSPPLESAPPLDAIWGSHPCLSQLDLGERDAAHTGIKGHCDGEAAVCRRTVHILNRPFAVPPRRCTAPHCPMPEISRQLPHLQTPSLFREDLPDETKQQHASRVVASHGAPRGRGRVGWASKERSTPENINMEQHAFRFQFPFPDRITYFYDFPRPDFKSPPLREAKPQEVRNALREKRTAQIKKNSEFHARLALSNYNTANNTKFELVEVRANCLFLEFGGSCYHYNFTAANKPTGQDEDGGGSGDEKLFFAEVSPRRTPLPRDEKDVLHCCILVEGDAGHCYGCEGEKPVVIHPSSRAYGGGFSTCIDMPGSLSSESDSD